MFNKTGAYTYIYINENLKGCLLLQTIELSDSLTSSPHCSTVVIWFKEMFVQNSMFGNMKQTLRPTYIGDVLTCSRPDELWVRHDVLLEMTGSFISTIKGW